MPNRTYKTHKTINKLLGHRNRTKKYGDFEKANYNPLETDVKYLEKKLLVLLTKISFTNRETILYDIQMDTEIKFQNTFVIEKDPYNSTNPDLEYDPLIKILEDLGLKRSSDTKANHLFGIINSKYFETNFMLLNDFQYISDFKNKFSLYNNLKICSPHHYNKYYPRSFLLDTNTYWNAELINRIYIARPIAGASGEDTLIVHNEATFNEAKKLMYKKDYKSGVSLTEYITNPLLINKRKFHCRAYLMFTLINYQFRAYLLHKSAIYTAKEPYKNADWYNKDIHDTHLKSSYRGDLVFPDDLINEASPVSITKEKTDMIYNNARMLCTEVAKIAVANVYHYSNTKNTWQIFGIDLLIKDDLNVFIMEINGKFTGYSGFNANKKLEKAYFDWIQETVVKPCLFPHLEVSLQDPSNIPVYDAMLDNY